MPLLQPREGGLVQDVSTSNFSIPLSSSRIELNKSPFYPHPRHPISDEKARIGYLSCKICGQKFSADTSPLDQPIDVYSLWIDACEDVANEQDR